MIFYSTIKLIYNQKIENLSFNKNFPIQMLNSKLQNILKGYNITQNNLHRCELIHVAINLHIRFSILRPQGKRNLQELFNLCSKSKIPLNIKLKYLMLIHYIMMKTDETYDWILENQIEVNQTSKSNPTKMGINQILESSIQYYYTYLRKLCIHSQLYQQVKSNSINRIKKLKISAIMEKIYIFINLIKSLEPLKSILIHLGRYYIQQYQLIIDFAQIMALDLSHIYNYVCSLLNALYEKVEKLQNQELQLFINIIDEIFVVHQILYVFLYNRYFHTLITVPQVKWFSLNKMTYQQMVKRVKGKNKKQSSDEIHLTDFESTYFDLNWKQQYEQI